MKIGTFDIIYTSSSNVNYSGTITKEGRIERLERTSEELDDEEWDDEDINDEIWYSYYEIDGIGTLTIATSKDMKLDGQEPLKQYMRQKGSFYEKDYFNISPTEEDYEQSYDDEMPYDYQIQDIKIIDNDLSFSSTDLLFCDLENLEQIEGLDIILSKVSTIEEYMFAGSGIKSLDLSSYNNITTIDDKAFEDCQNLENILLPNSLKKINSFVFFGCSKLTNIILPDTIEYIGKRTFDSCSSLTSITIPANVKTIGEICFYRSGLTEVYYNAINASENTFSSEDTNTPFYIDYFEISKITKLVIGKEVQVIPKDMFAGMKYLNTVVFESPSSLETIEEFAFSESFDKYAERIELHIPSSITEIEENAFFFTPENLYIYIDKEEGSLDDDSWEIDLENPIHWKDN